MSLTVDLSVDKPTVFGNKKIVFADVTFDSSYPTGGESIAASDFGLNTLQYVIPLGPAVDSDGTGGSNAVPVFFDASTSKLQTFESGASGTVNPEKGSGESLANYLVHVIAVGY